MRNLFILFLLLCPCFILGSQVISFGQSPKAVSPVGSPSSGALLASPPATSPTHMQLAWGTPYLPVSPKQSYVGDATATTPASQPVRIPRASVVCTQATAGLPSIDGQEKVGYERNGISIELKSLAERGSLAGLATTRQLRKQGSIVTDISTNTARKRRIQSIQARMSIHQRKVSQAHTSKANMEMGNIDFDELKRLSEQQNRSSVDKFDPKKSFLQAIKSGDLGLMKVLKNSININDVAVDIEGNTYLHVAVQSQNNMAANFILQQIDLNKDVVLNRKNEHGRTILHEVCRFDNLDIFNEIIKHPKIPLTVCDYMSDNGNTPRNYAYDNFGKWRNREGTVIFSSFKIAPQWKPTHAKYMVQKLDEIYFAQKNLALKHNDKGQIAKLKVYEQTHDFEGLIDKPA